MCTVRKCSVSEHSTHFRCTIWRVFCFCAQHTCLIYRMESVLFLCIVYISDVPSGKCSVSVQRTHFRCTIWNMFCFSSQYTFQVHPLESVLSLWTVHIFVPFGKCSVSVHKTHFCTVWEVFSDYVHSTHFSCIMWKVSFLCSEQTFFVPFGKCCICAQYTSDAQQCDFFKVFYFFVQFQYVLFCLHCFLVILPWWRKFQSLSKHVTAVLFLISVTDTKYSAHILLRVRYDVVRVRYNVVG